MNPDPRLVGARACLFKLPQSLLWSLMWMITQFLGDAAHAVPLSFADLYRDPGAPVSIAPDGASATLAEDAGFFAVILSNVPGFGDPTLIVAQAGASLSFDFDFGEPAGNDDVFHVALLDGVTGSVFDPTFEAFYSSTQAGQVSFDLSSLVGMTLGLQIELVAGLGDAALDSLLQLSNLELNLPVVDPGPDPEQVPEPSSIALFGAAALAALGWRRPRARGRR